MLIKRDMAAVAAVRATRALAEVQALRRAAYALETDPLIGQVLAGEMTVAEYKAARAAIKARYPKP